MINIQPSPDPDPATDPSGFLVTLLGKYFPPGFMESLVRTWVPVGVGSVLAWLAVHWHIVVSAHASATAGIVAGGLVVAGYYALARLVERRWPRLGRWMVAANLVKAAPPVYAAPGETVKVINRFTGTVRSE